MRKVASGCLSLLAFLTEIVELLGFALAKITHIFCAFILVGQ